MRIAITSDWHLRSTRHYTRTTDAGMLLRFLQSADSFDYIVVAGDAFELIVDTWHNIKRDHEELVAVMKQLIESGKLLYIYGNHDEKMKHIWKTPETLMIPGTKIQVIHGHQFDIISHAIFYPFKIVATKGCAFLERKGLPQASKAVFTLAEKAGYISKSAHFTHTRFYRGAYQLTQHNDVDTVVMGHTHAAHVSDPYVLNSGCCVSGKADYILIENDSITLRDMSVDFPKDQMD